MDIALAVGLAGAVGSMARYLIDGVVQDRTTGWFPFGTLTVNLIGSLVLGLLAGAALRYSGIATTRTIIGTGFCGGLTTWSTASWETVRLVEEGAVPTAMRFTAVNLAGSLAAAGLGLLVFVH